MPAHNLTIRKIDTPDLLEQVFQEAEIISFTEDGKEPVKPVRKRGVVQSTPTERLSLIRMRIASIQKELKSLKEDLKMFKKKEKKLSKLLDDINNV